MSYDCELENLVYDRHNPITPSPEPPGGYTVAQPRYALRVQLTGENSNLFNLVGIVGQALKRAGVPSKDREALAVWVMKASSWDDGLARLSTIVEVC